MRTKVLILAGVAAVFFSLWFVAQQALFEQGVDGDAILIFSGLSALLLIIASLLKNKKLPPAEIWKWLAVAIASNIALAELLVRVTQSYGASLGANAMGAAPLAALLIAWILLGEVPGRWGRLGIAVIFVGVLLLHTRVAALVSGVAQTPWIVLAVGIALSAGLGIVAIKPAIQLSDEFMAPGVTLFFSFGIYGLVKALFGPGLESVLQSFSAMDAWWLAVLVVGFGVSNWASGATYHYTFAASAGALKRLAAPLTVLISWLVFGIQQNPITLLLGSLIIVAGAIMISLDAPRKASRSVRVDAAGD